MGRKIIEPKTNNFEALMKLRNRPISGRPGDRIQAICWLLGAENQKEQQNDFAHIYGVNLRTLKRWIRHFNEVGVEGGFWRNQKPGRRSFMDDIPMALNVWRIANGIPRENNGRWFHELHRQATKQLGIKVSLTAFMRAWFKFFEDENGA
jgi:hypothetical protein